MEAHKIFLTRLEIDQLTWIGVLMQLVYIVTIVSDRQIRKKKIVKTHLGGRGWL